jgi:hypothetical protein
VFNKNSSQQLADKNLALPHGPAVELAPMSRGIRRRAGFDENIHEKPSALASL